MIKVAICDDSISELGILYKMLNRCQEQLEIKICTDSFSDGGQLLSAIKSGKFYDLIIIDVVMPGMYGTDVAKQIYSLNNVTQFVFLTSTRDFAVESYEVDALDYIIKPLCDERLKNVLGKYLKYKKKSETDEIIIKGCGLTRIALHTICYVESISHQLTYHIFDGQTFSCRQNLSEVEEILMEKEFFIKPHRSYIVNMDYIVKIDQGCITIKNGDKIYASRAKVKELTNLYLKYKFERGEG